MKSTKHKNSPAHLNHCGLVTERRPTGIDAPPSSCEISLVTLSNELPHVSHSAPGLPKTSKHERCRPNLNHILLETPSRPLTIRRARLHYHCPGAVSVVKVPEVISDFAVIALASKEEEIYTVQARHRVIASRVRYSRGDGSSRRPAAIGSV